MKYYIAGPMSGIPQFNYPAFDKMADKIRDMGHEVMSPAEMDSEAVRHIAMASEHGNLSEFNSDSTWGDFLARDVKIVADEVDGVVLLPGWTNSRGARLEAFIALTVQKPVMRYTRGCLEVMDPSTAAKLIAGYVVDQGDVSRYEEAS
jgi:hypothetical protein